MVFICLLSSTFARRGGLTFVRRDKSKQKHSLCQRSERGHNHRFGFYQVDLHSCFSARLCGIFKLILIGVYSISPLCLSGAVLRTSLFKTAFLCLFATSLLSHSLISSFTLCYHYSLPSLYPTVDSRSLLFWLAIRGGFGRC